MEGRKLREDKKDWGKEGREEEKEEKRNIYAKTKCKQLLSEEQSTFITNLLIGLIS